VKGEKYRKVHFFLSLDDSAIMNVRNGFFREFLSFEPDKFLLERLKLILTSGSEVNSEL